MDRSIDQTNSQRGFTLVELMIVVAIIGVMLAAAVLQGRQEQTTMDAAIQLSRALAEASRIALSNGPLRPDVVTNTGDTARSQVEIEINADGFASATLDLVQEDPLPSADYSFAVKRSWRLPRHLEVVGYTLDAVTTTGNVPTQALAANDFVSIRCYADGSCDAATLYLQESGDKERVRVVVMPLAGSPIVFRGW